MCGRLNNNLDLGTTYQMLDYMLNFDPYNEELQYLAMEMLLFKDGAKAAIEHYRSYANDLMENIGVEPGDEIKEFYARLVRG